jgi:hypothetical protein
MMEAETSVDAAVFIYMLSQLILAVHPFYRNDAPPIGSRDGHN